MTHIAACTNVGTTSSVNQDACCALVADTPLGDVAMGVVCDGVGGLSLGELASATVVNRFARWFEDELPTLMAGMADAGTFGFDVIEAVWRAQLDSLNSVIQAHGVKAGSLGTTFTGVITCGGRYLAGQVGDCRLYRIGRGKVTQLTEDQTLVAHKLALGELTPEEAKTFPQQHVIMQAVGTERMLKPVFTQGSVGDGELLVLCSDGAYRRSGEEGLQDAFSRAKRDSETSLERACKGVVDRSIAQGETDNLTVICLSVAPGRRGNADATPTMVTHPDSTQTAVVDVHESEGVDAMPTRVAAIDAIPTSVVDSNSTPTMIGAGSSAMPDAAAVNESVPNAPVGTDAIPTAVVSADATPTAVVDADVTPTAVVSADATPTSVVRDGDA